MVVNESYQLEELAAAIQKWCAEHQVFPANGQAAEQITERTIRYYRTLGILDAPLGGYQKTFGPKHLLQLIALRIYQAQGFPLRKIRDQLYGQGEEQLADFVAKTARRQTAPPAFVPAGPESEHWTMTPLTDDFLLISRRAKTIPAGRLQQIRALLAEEPPARSSPPNPNP